MPTYLLIENLRFSFLFLATLLVTNHYWSGLIGQELRWCPFQTPAYSITLFAINSYVCKEGFNNEKSLSQGPDTFVSSIRKGELVQNFSNVITLAREDDDFIMAFVSKSTEDLGSYLDNIKNASAAANLPLLLFTQHKSKTLLMLLGDTKITSLISQIVEKAGSQNWEHTAELLELEIEIRGLIFKVNTELK